jgi:SpoVK/Ycf46/Vps4 family AAA+-type ATPase
MQDDRTGVFFVFTANNMEKFAPELVDRFEGRFFIDLPSTTERKEILKIHLTLRGWDIEGFNMDKLVKASKDFSGRNIEDAINEAMGNAFSEDRKLSNVDLLAVFEEVIPTSKTKKTEIETMRTFVENGMMRRANDRIDEEQSSKGGKQLRSFA